MFKCEEINGHGICPTYLYRWEIFRWGDRAVYLHHFVGDDWSLDYHDHPKQFISIGLWGCYDEHAPDRSKDVIRWQAPWKRSFPAEHRHRITLPKGDCWTLVIVGKKTREWGFWNKGYWLPWRTYVNSPLAEERKGCP